jgi:signal transduction histidine kinase
MSLPPDLKETQQLTQASLRTRSGEEVVVEVAPTQGVVFEGVAARLLVGRDVTERVRMQEQLIVADRLASVGLLAAGVAHEVNNPLAYVLNNIEMARKQLAGLDDDVDADLRTALGGVDRIRTIVRELLDLSRGGRAGEELLDMPEVVASTLALAAREIERTATLKQDIGPCPRIRASEPRIAQMLLNLISDALQRLRGLPRESAELLVRVGGAPDGRVLIEVSDTRRGDGDAAQRATFDRGPSLVVARQLVKEAGGELSFIPENDGGATRRVLLPGREA